MHILLQCSEGGTVTADKALLKVSSSVLREALVACPSSETLNVDGDVETWRTIVEMPKQSSRSRLAQLVAKPKTALLAVKEVTDFAHKFDCGGCSVLCEHGTLKRKHDDVLRYQERPCSPIFWVGLADKYAMPQLMAPALKYLASGRGKADRASVLRHGRAQVDSENWPLVCAVLEGCES